jgi:hypothetical protein
MSPEEAKRLLAMSGNLKVHVMLALGYGCGLRACGILACLTALRNAVRSETTQCFPTVS